MNNVKSIEEYKNSLDWRKKHECEDKGYLIGTTQRFIEEFYCFNSYDLNRKIERSEPLSYDIDLKLGLVIRTYKDCTVYSEVDKKTNKTYIIDISVNKPQLIEVDFVNKKVIRTKTDKLKRDLIYKQRLDSKNRHKLNKFKSYSYKSEMLWEKKVA